MKIDIILVYEVGNAVKKTCHANTDIKMKMNPNMSTFHPISNTLHMVMSKIFQHMIQWKFKKSSLSGEKFDEFNVASGKEKVAIARKEFVPFIVENIERKI